MEKRLKFELKRKFIHLLSLLFIVIYILMEKLYHKQAALLSLTLILIIFLIIEYFRLVKRRKIPIVCIFWRDSEKNKLAGYIYFIIGAIIAFSIFDMNIAVAALLMTTFGDTAAALFGMKFGKHWLKKIPNTAWEGVIAEFVVNLLIGFILLNNYLIILAMALTATFVETRLTHIDDNIGIPVFSGFVAQIILVLESIL